jgi:hypothetical protein
MAKPLKILRDYDKISALLRQQDYVKDFIPMTRGGVAILGGSGMNFLLAFGCNFDDFQRVFGNPVEAVEGQLLTNGDHGLLVNEKPAEPAQDAGLLAGPGAELNKQPQQGPGRAARPAAERSGAGRLRGVNSTNMTCRSEP